MYNAFVLVRNLNSDSDELLFHDFRIRRIQEGDGPALDAARTALQTDEVFFGDWILQRDYEALPPYQGGGAPFGRIPIDIEDLLLLLRLFRPGDLSFARFTVRNPNGTHSVQAPYFAISDLMQHSVLPYEFNAGDVGTWEAFSAELVPRPAWTASWFGVSRQFFLRGGAREYNPTWNEVERIVNYASALESALVPEMDFSRSRFAERGARIINADALAGAQPILQDLYDLRSSIVHGAVISEDQRTRLYERWTAVEDIVRRVLVAAIQLLPDQERAKEAQLRTLFDVTDADRIQLLRQKFAELSTESKAAALQSLSHELDRSRRQQQRNNWLRRTRKWIRKWLWKSRVGRPFLRSRRQRDRRGARTR